MAFDGRLLSGVTAFLAVVEQGSFVRAAETLGLSDSGVSRALARLEGRLGVRLLDRTTRSLRLTDEGARFHAEAAPLLARLADAADAAAQATSVVRGRLRVEVDPFFARLVLAPRLGEFLETYPELMLELITTETAGDLVAHRFDLAIRFGPPSASGAITRKLLDTRILTVAAPAYLERHGRPARPSELRGHRCIHYRDPATGRPFDWEFHQGREILPVEVDGPLILSDVGTMLNACVAGVGIAQVMALGSEPLLAAGALIELFPDWPDETFPLHIYHPSRHQPPAKVEALIGFCAGLARQAV
jgi:DNA-binding transcriptional LysR family regulator